MWSSVVTRVRRRLQRDTGPGRQAIRDSFCVRVVQLRSAKGLAGLAALEVDSSIVSSAGVHSNSDGDLLACPFAMAFRASELAHDARVMLLESTTCSVHGAEVEYEIMHTQ